MLSDNVLTSAHHSGQLLTFLRKSPEEDTNTRNMYIFILIHDSESHGAFRSFTKCLVETTGDNKKQRVGSMGKR